MSERKPKIRKFQIHLFNIKISPKSENEDFTDLYSSMIKRIKSESLGANTGGDKFLEFRTLHATSDNRVLYGKFIHYTILQRDKWYNRDSDSIERIDIDASLFPNAKEGEYYFIPEAHRFCFVTGTKGIPINAVEKFLESTLERVTPEDKEVIITRELTDDSIERILNAEKLFRLEIDISYSNNDLTEAYEELWDSSLRNAEAENLNITVKSFKKTPLNLNNFELIKSALKLSQSNGTAKAIIHDSKGKTITIATEKYPRKELITTTEGNEPNSVLDSVLRLFRPSRHN